MQQTRLENLIGSQLVKKSSAFYGTKRFFTPFTSVCHLSLSWARSIPSMLPPTNFPKIHLILSSHLRLIHRIQGSPNPSHFTIAPIVSSFMAALWSLSKIICRLNRSTTLRLTAVLGSLPSPRWWWFNQENEVIWPKNIQNTAFTCTYVITKPISVKLLQDTQCQCINFANRRLMKNTF
jgi:hypothetical protein